MKLQFDYRKNTVLDILIKGKEKYGERVVLSYRKEDEWKDISWKALYKDIMSLASFLIGEGISKGEIVSIYSANRPEWVVADFATLSCAGVDATIYPTNSSDEAAYIINDTQSSICFCEGQFQVDNLLNAKDKMPSLKKIVVFDVVVTDNPMVISFAKALTIGRKEPQNKKVEQRTLSITGSDVMTIIYSSGTTGMPKGVMLTHSNIMFICINFNKQQNLPEGYRTLSLLPLSHAVERTMGYYATLADGGIILYSRGTDFFAEDLKEVKPFLGIYVPRVFEKIYNGIMIQLQSAPDKKKNIFNKAFDIGLKAAPYFMKNENPPLILRTKYAFFDKLVFSKLREALGMDRGIGFGSAGAPLASEIHDFFWAMGLQIRKGYGLTETSPVLNVDGDPSVNRIKADGWMAPFPETEMMIAEDGEVLVKGPQVMKGYLNKPEATQEMFTEDGWFKTGDIGIMDEDRYLKITDRKKDIIVTAGGKNVAPLMIENTVLMDPFIEQIAVLGDGKKYIVALIVPAFDTLNAWAEQSGIDELDNISLVKNAAVKDKYNEIIEKINVKFGRVEQIKKFELLPYEFTQESGELTPTLKLKRRIVMNNYSELIESMYL